MKRIIKVTQKHIDAGNFKTSTSCAISLAVKCVFPTQLVNTHPNTLIIGDQRFVLPAAIRLFVQEFDDHLTVAPFTFRVDTMKGVIY